MTSPQPIAALLTARRIEHVRAVAGAHEAVGAYAEAVISSPSAREFQRMRRRRNKSEYDDIAIGRGDLAADLTHAEAIIQAVRNDF